MKILILSIYDPSERSHGGQIRVHEITKYLISKGYNVCNAGILSETKNSLPPHFLRFPEESINHNGFSNWFLMDDAKLDIAIRGDQSFAKQLYDNISFHPDIILVEQPWLIRLAVQYRREYAVDAKIIYGSQNVESDLKESILLKYFPSAHAKAASSIVKEIELFAIENADACIAVTLKDSEYIASLCGDKPVVVVPNGSSSCDPSPKSLSAMSCLAIPRKKYALFCASAHPPNIHGFYEYLSGHSACFAGDTSMVIVGSVGDAIKGDKRYDASITFKHKLLFTGKVSHSVLPAIVSSAHINILPISQGGGSNLKTAEALLADSYIVATPTALRGYEFAADYDHVFVSDSPRDFKAMVNEAFQRPPCRLDIELRNTIKQRVHWEHVLTKLDDVFTCLRIN